MQLEPSRPTAPHKRDCAAAATEGASVGVFYLGQDELKRLTWEHLESVRLKKLGIPNRYSRHLGKDFALPQEKHPSTGPSWKTNLKPKPVTNNVGRGDDRKAVSCTNNSLAPFYTVAKPTCGYFFSRQTDNKKRNFGIPPSDLVKWRSFTQ
ncbi:ciliary microtubule inner protein 3-like [Babylonia areolata]|uniref:ciliary microtubule inner protein 3-like n=1 Tax=Babylonia areolata TaxID=304850 RepID=UPI003FD1E84E